ncbi:hypothetical protein D9V28_11125 [Mycetocola zhadangensis]|uniref:Uncharacterized protein n=1 Tax=Mycetocola zhadangensis TaxID=1164595 RepID=A0A3L7IWC5_9MICO|nr:hypothetical protein D9V28_11125 [Mycetocola zhadangensis]
MVPVRWETLFAAQAVRIVHERTGFEWRVHARPRAHGFRAGGPPRSPTHGRQRLLTPVARSRTVVGTLLGRDWLDSGAKLDRL